MIQREEARTANDISLADQLSIVSWSARNLEADEETQLERQCVSERESSLLEENDEILWCEMLDTTWKRLEDKGAVCILSDDRAKNTKTQFRDRLSSDPHVSNRSNPGKFKARWCLRGYVDPDVMELVGGGSIQSLTVSQLERLLSCQIIVSHDWNLQLGDSRGALLEADSLDRKQEPLYSSLPSGGIPGVSDDAVFLILGHICGLNDASQRWWKKFDAVMFSIGFFRRTSDACVYTPRGPVGKPEGIFLHSRG